MNTEDTFEIDLKELFYVLFDKIYIIIAVTIIFAAAAFGYTKLFIPYEYTTSLSMFVKNNHEISTAKKALELSDINASQELVNAYIEILNDDTVIDQLINNMNRQHGKGYMQSIFGTVGNEGNTNTAAVKKCISLSSKNSTEVLQVSVTTTSPVLSADICNCMAEIAPDVLKRVVGAGSVEVIGSAKLPYAPSAPSIKKNTCLGAVAGLFLACGIIFLLYILKNTVNNIDKAADMLSLNPLGEIPMYTDNKENNANSEIKAKTNLKKNTERQTIVSIDDFVTQEAYNTLRANIMFSLAASGSKSLIVTSALAGDGKSVNAANLALCFAQNNAKVLLIDADLRRPVQHKIFSLNNSKGLSTVLSGLSSLNDSVFKYTDRELYIMPSGEIPPNPQELLGSKNMEKLIKELEQSYDYIIIDMPPGGVVSDCQVLSSLVPNVVLIASSNRTPISVIKKLIASLKFTNANVLGLVLNKVELQSKSYKRYSYKYKYKYY